MQLINNMIRNVIDLSFNTASGMDRMQYHRDEERADLRRRFNTASGMDRMQYYETSRSVYY